MRVILVINESPIYIGCLNTDSGTVPRVGEQVLMNRKTFTVDKVLYDLNEDEVRVYLFNGS